MTPIKNAKNKYVNLHILETAERDKNTKLQTYKNPLGLRDNEILEAVWRKWALESGYKSFEWKNINKRQSHNIVLARVAGNFFD
ncbi:MAG: hypothetical protein IPH02_00150 [Sphingobacteriales bacterium]|nr:hypothetical protein [Sphingobacteriales bacterium]